MLPLLLRLGAVLVATIAATAVFLLTATPVFGFWAQALAALATFVTVGVRLLQRVERRAGRAVARAWGWLAGASILYVSGAQLLVGRAPDGRPEPLPPFGAVREWVLPDGGRLAYLHVPAAENTRAHDAASPPPVLVLHDGPGLPLLPALAEATDRPYDTLGVLGHDVYYYDQRGAGYSSRLDLRRAAPYSVAGHVADLEVARARIDAERVVLAATGWGATLAVQYLLTHPGRVAGLILESPGPLWPAEWPALIPATARARLTDVEASLYAAAQRPPLRLALGRMMADFSRPAAHQFITDAEADVWWARSLHTAWSLGQPRLTCRNDSTPALPTLAGAGFFAHSYTLADAARLPDPRPTLRTLDLPVLVLRGACEFVDARIGTEYATELRTTLLVPVPEAGHDIWREQPAAFRASVAAFVAALPQAP
jgi:pimeloyl-ACP methyl ester carboxylesterase